MPLNNNKLKRMNSFEFFNKIHAGTKPLDVYAYVIEIDSGDYVLCVGGGDKQQGALKRVLLDHDNQENHFNELALKVTKHCDSSYLCVIDGVVNVFFSDYEKAEAIFSLELAPIECDLF